MRFASLFAGVGGFDLAFERAGMTCVAQIEIDTRCREVLAAHWSDVPRFEDVHEVTASRILMGSGNGRRVIGNRRGSVSDPQIGNHPRDLLHGGTHREPTAIDLLCGGFPCQDYSVAGKRGGLAGDRGALWWQFHRLIAECRPRWVVGENVPGLLSSNDGRDFGAIVGSLVELGYGVVWRVLDAQYFGVAQRRRRVFIVGHIGGIPRPEILAFAEGCAGDTPPRREAGKRVAALTANGLGGGGPDDNLAQAGHLIPQTVGALRTRDWKGPPVDVAEPSLVVGFDWTQSGQPLNDLSPTIRVGSGIDLASPPAIAFAQNTRDEVRDLGNLAGALAAQPGMKQTTYLALQDVRGMAKDQNGAGVSGEGVAYTLDQTGAQGVAASSVRRLTPLECERLQGFPDNWTAGQSDTQRYRQMGNAVAVPVAEWIGHRLVAA